jgi:ergothioneine biosynthesis protein EgtB
MNKQDDIMILNNAKKNRLMRKILLQRFKTVRSFTNELCETLVTEDYVIQSMPDVSPTKWHLAHTSWFFETFILSKSAKNYQSLFPQYNYLFNSYYVQVGERWTRAKRGLLSRPTVKDVYDYRKYIDELMLNFFEKSDEKLYNEFAQVVEIGIHHEQQHQELLITDIKHVFSVNPLHPVYKEVKKNNSANIPQMKWIDFEEGIYEIGLKDDTFSYDNESPRHKEYLQGFKLANRLVTNDEYMEFINAKGYKRPELWLSEGHAAAEAEKWEAPMYWEKKDGEWWNFKLTGFEKVNPDEPVCHVSHYEADAYARWAGARLATEAEWERAAENISIEGNFVENRNFHPVPLEGNDKNSLKQMYGDVWEWTGSAYLPYPGYKTLPGALGEYNGKFMSNQMVLRGGSCATSVTHIRKTYRNFFPSNARWQFMGIRLAKDGSIK